jgi:transposase
MKKNVQMQIVNPNSAGIDVGSRSHYVAIGQEPSQVKEFNVYTSGHQEMVAYLKEHQIQSIAMESTGSYWQSLFLMLQANGFEVLLVPGSQIQNLRGKTDVMDCQWIQKLHSLGLLRSCYLPSEVTMRIRTIARHRKSIVEDCSKLTNRMQKSLRLMNLRLDVVINDIMGVSGRKIIEAILSGETDPVRLSKLADKRVKNSRETIANALHGQFQAELLFELKQNYKQFLALQLDIKECDLMLEEILASHTEDVVLPENFERVKKQLKGKNQASFDLQEFSCKMVGVNLFKIEGVSVNTVLTFISEIGNDIYKFKSSKQFVSWLRLSPQNKITGGKVVSSRTKKGKNKMAIALRDAANTIERLKNGHLIGFFKKIAYKKGRGAAITATARKMATIIWNMVTKNQEYNPELSPEIKAKIQSKKLKTLNRLLAELNLETADLQLVKV